MLEKNKITLFNTITCILIWCFLAAGFTDIIDTALPQGSDDPAEADDNMRRIQGGYQELLNVDHLFDLTGTAISDADSGEHRKVLFHIPIASTPTVAADHGSLRTKDVANGAVTLAELHWTDEDEQELQLSSAGNNLASDVYLTGTDAAGTGSVNLIKADANDQALIFHSASKPAQLATSDPPIEDQDIANKKFVDDSVPTTFWTTSGATVFNTTMSSANTFQDLDLSATIGSNAALCFFEVSNTTNVDAAYVMKPNGEGGVFTKHILTSEPKNAHGGTVTFSGNTPTEVSYMTCAADSSGIVEHGATSTSNTWTIKLIGYIK